MPYDIVDAYEDIRALSAQLKAVIEALQEKDILPKEEEKKDAMHKKR